MQKRKKTLMCENTLKRPIDYYMIILKKYGLIYHQKRKKLSLTKDNYSKKMMLELETPKMICF